MQAQTQVGANVYEIRKDSERIGYISFLETSSSELKLKALEQVRRVFEPTSIEEVGNQDAITYTGVKYFLGKSGIAQIVLNYREFNNRFQIDKSRQLTEALEFDLLYRGNKLTSYWTPGFSDGNIRDARVPLNLVVEGRTLSITEAYEQEIYIKTLNLDVAYRGHPGEILYLAPLHEKNKISRASKTSDDFFNVLKNGSLFSIPFNRKPHEDFRKIFAKSDGDCAYFGKVVQYFYCSDTHEAYKTSKQLSAELKEQPWTGYMTYEFPTGVVEIGIARNFAEDMFFKLVNDLRPKVAYSGRRDMFFRKSSENIDFSKAAKSNSNIQLNPSYLQDFRVDFYDGKTNRMAWTRFWMVDELTRTKIISLYREFLDPDHIKLLNVENQRSVASTGQESSEKVVGMYFEKDRSWVTRNAHRYSNKPSKNISIGFDRYDYETKTSSTLSYLKRSPTSVLAYANLNGQWWPKHNYWGVEGSLRLTSISHLVNSSSVNGLVYKSEIGSVFRYYFTESVISSEVQLGISYSMDVDSVDSNSALGSLTLSSIPLMAKYSQHYGESWKWDLRLRYSPLVTVNQSYASAISGSTSGSLLDLAAGVYYKYTGVPFLITGNIHYSNTQFKVGSANGDKTELGAMLGVNILWD